MRRNAGDYVKSWGAALIRGAASNPEFTVSTNFTFTAENPYNPPLYSMPSDELNLVRQS